MRLGRDKSEASSKPQSSTPVVLPDHGEPINLVLISGETIHARVLERGPDMLLVAILVPVELRQSQLEGMTLEYTASSGRISLQGAITIENPAQPDVLRVDSPRSVEVLQQREFVRINAARPVLVYAGRDRIEIESYTVDLSGGGFLLAGPDTLRIGDEIQFLLTLTPGELPITGTAKVVRTDLRGRRAVSFETISDLDQRRLVRFIFDCQRTELRMGIKQDGHDGG
jgi:PilZ domain